MTKKQISAKVFRLAILDRTQLLAGAADVSRLTLSLIVALDEAGLGF